MKVGFLGPKGTYTHQAVEQYFKDYEPVTCSSIQESVEKGDTAVIPFENSLGGGVGDAIDILREKNIQVTGEVLVNIEHVLASKKPKDEIKRVRSHPQALSQCRKIINQNQWEKAESSSTAKAAQELKEGEAAICSALAAEINDLNIIETDIQDEESNVTRFLVVNGEKTEKNEKTSIILEPGEDRPGLLANMLSCFSGHEINLSYIQSRPTRNRLGEYYFYVEAEADQNSEDFKDTLKCLQSYSKVKIVGSYRKGVLND